MKNIFKKAMQMVSCVAMTTLLLSSCGEKSENDIEYLAVKMSKSDGWSIIDKNGKVVVDDEYPSTSTISAIHDGVYWVMTGNTYQLFSINDPKKPVVDEEFTRATEFHAGRAVVSALNQTIRIIDTSGKVVATLDQNIKRCMAFSEEGYAVYQDFDNKWGIIDKNGKIVVKAEYYGIMPTFHDGVVLAAKKEDDKAVAILTPEGKKLGAIDTEKYELCCIEYSEGKILAISKDDSDARLIILDKEGKKLFTIKKSSGEYYNAKYMNGYVTFKNSDGKYGVADNEGNEVVRAKYSNIKNLGHGEFAVTKDGQKWGVINVKDETILDFDYNSAMDATIGGNYWMKDGGEYIIVKKGTKDEVLVSFYDYSQSASEFANYISVEAIVNKVMDVIEEYEKPRTAAQLGEAFSLSAENHAWSNEITRAVAIDDGIALSVSARFSDMTQQKTHTERVSYGYYSYNRTVSDGWFWTDNLPYEIYAFLSKDDDIDANTVYTKLKERVSHGRNKVKAENDNSYYKSVKYDGGETNVYIHLSNENDVVSFTIVYRDYDESYDDAEDVLEDIVEAIED